MAELDPYFRNALDAKRQVVLAARPIILAQDGADQDGVVQIAANRDVLVIADEVTVRGSLLARRASEDGAITGPGGSTVVILARSLDTIPGHGTDARIDVSGGVGVTSTKIWTAPAATGKEGTRGHSIWHPTTDDVAPGGTGYKGDDGQPGDPGGGGGRGGTIDVRCGFTAPTTALAVVADGGNGGSGLTGQAGGRGGQGGEGADSEVYWLGTPSSATLGGKGGPGGAGGNGGAPGAGGAPGTVRIRVRNGPPSGITPSLNAGTPGTTGSVGAVGNGGPPGDGGRPWGEVGLGGPGGNYPQYGWKPRVGNGGVGDLGGTGTKPQDAEKGKDGVADIVGTCDDSELLKSLAFPVTAQTALLLDRIQVDHLVATGNVVPEELSALADRIDWVTTLLGAYAPASATDVDELDAQRAAAQVEKERFQAGLDFYGHAADYVPLGSIESYQQRFDAALTALESIQRECDDRVAALEQASRTASDLDQAKISLSAQQRAYDAAATTERETIAGLATRIDTADKEMIASKQALLHPAVAEFENAVYKSCRISLSDLVETIGQMAFLGEHTFQRGAMIVGQALKLGNTAASKVLAADGTQVDKQWVIGQLTATELSAQKLPDIVGGKAGIRLSDPGAVKLLADQSQFDKLCDEFWNVSGAAKAKEAFDDYVSAVQARNAHVMTLNESLARLRAYVAGGAQTASALAAAQTQAAGASDPGAVALVAQLTRMASRARADCIESLYLASRAYSFWALAPADALADVLSDLAVGRPLAMSPTALQAAGERLLTRYDKAMEADLSERPIWFPPRNAPATQRGKIIELTPQSHPSVFERLRTQGTASFGLRAPRARTTADENPFAGLSDVRLSSVRCWLNGVGWAAGHGPIVRVDLEHLGRETLVGRDDSVTVFRHEPVHVVMEYDSTRPLDPGGIVAASDLQDGDSNAIGALIGPFARWRVRVEKSLNPGVDLSGVDKITLEVRVSAQSFGMPQSA
jgi:hypothetical protein